MDRPVRQPAVAGTFYPKDPGTLKKMVQDFLSQVEAPQTLPPVALVVPHAGYIYSGLTAAHGFRHLKPAPPLRPQRVFILAPSHRAYQEGISVGHYSAYATPLGLVPIHQETVDHLARLPDVSTDAAAHHHEHSLEVQLPFLQETLKNFNLVPMIYGDISGGHLADILTQVWHPQDLLIISSDLSHYFPYDQARHLDAQCHSAIASGDPKSLEKCEACGNKGISALLELSRRHRWHSSLVDYRNSGDTAGDKNRVVGYASYVFHPPTQTSDRPPETSDSPPVSSPFRLELLPGLARTHLEHFLEGNSTSIDRKQLQQDFPPLSQTGACFVTLTKKGRLRGCIGSLEAHRTLLDDLLENAQAAAVHDPRFRPLLRQELDEVLLEVSILTPAVPMPYQGTQDLLNQLKPGIHGVILSLGNRRATFLPQVWEQLPDKITFLTNLCQKAGLDGQCWQRHPGIQVYTVTKIKESKE
ncbi:MAG: AmmeMemoRadiSam system protein B [Magnetococcales bacterium]|nr:AmmeMemoRadiSam system protein B [Magnetococcales bacterium]